MRNKLSTVLATFYAQGMHESGVWFLQVMSHVAAAQSASLVFLCIHRENYDFLETLSHQLSGKVNRQMPQNTVAAIHKH